MPVVPALLCCLALAAEAFVPASLAQPRQYAHRVSSATVKPADTMTTPPWSVHKFGGTSVADAVCMTKVAELVSGELTDPLTPAAVVVSAMGAVASPKRKKVTDLLLQTAHASARDDGSAGQRLQDVIDLHAATVDELLPSDAGEAVKAAIAKDVGDLKHLLSAITLMREASPRLLELVSGYGELWSAKILTALMNFKEPRRRWKFVDARRFLFVRFGAGDLADSSAVLYEESRAALEALIAESAAEGGAGAPPLSLVITGYVCSTEEGGAATLGRDGSDLSASVVGRLLRAKEVSIWTDVDGVLSADPRQVPGARVLTDVSFAEAAELSYFGAKVLHPKTMAPALASAVPGEGTMALRIRNTFKPADSGTRICVSRTATNERSNCVCGFSTIQNVAMLNVEGAGMLGVPGVAARLFGALERIKVNVSLIAQASSEQSICVAIRSDDAERAGAAVSECFRAELSLGHISDVTITSPCAIIAAVGDGMAHTSGVAGRFLSALGTAGVNVIGMSQGCSQRNISVIISEADSAKALNSVHNAFCGLAHSPGGANISTQSFGLIESRIAGRATPTLRSPDGSVSPPPPGAAAANSPGAARWRTKAAGAQE